MVFNSILLWYLFIITVSFFAVMIRFTAIDILKISFLIVVTIILSIFVKNLDYLNNTKNLLMSVVVFSISSYIFYILLKLIYDKK